MSNLKKFSFAEISEVKDKFFLKEVLNSNTLSGFYKQNLFELVDINNISINDFVFIIGCGLFRVVKEKS